MRSFTSRLRIAMVLVLVALVVPSIALAKGTPKEKSLYQRLGGKKGVTAVVNDFVAGITADTRVNSFFAATTSDPAKLAQFKQHFYEKLCQASGGPCKYTGRDMKTVHEGMKITSDNFNAVVEDLTAALDKHKVGDSEKNQLIGILSPMKSDIASSGE